MATLNRTPQGNRVVNREAAPPPRAVQRTSKPAPKRSDVLARYSQDSGVDEDTLHRRATQSSGQYDSYINPDLRFFKAQVGVNAVRILPRTWEPEEASEKFPKLAENGLIDKYFSFTIFVHNNIGTDNATYLCPEKMMGEHCSVCDEYRRLKADGLSDEAYQISAQKRHLYWIIDRGESNIGPKIWSVSTKIDKEIASRCKTRSGKTMAITNPLNGYDVLFRREGQKLNTTYLGWDIDRDPSPLSEDEDVASEWLTTAQENPLPDVLNFYSDDYVAGVLAGGGGRTEEEEEEEQPEERPSRGGNGRLRRAAEEEQVEEEVPEEEEPIEEEVPEEEEIEPGVEEEEPVEEEVPDEEEQPASPPRRAPPRQPPARQPVQASGKKPAPRSNAVAEAQTAARGQLSRMQQTRRK
jgi:hypothetical protein